MLENNHTCNTIGSIETCTVLSTINSLVIEIIWFHTQPSSNQIISITSEFIWYGCKSIREWTLAERNLSSLPFLYPSLCLPIFLFLSLSFLLRSLSCVFAFYSFSQNWPISLFPAQWELVPSTCWLGTEAEHAPTHSQSGLGPPPPPPPQGGGGPKRGGGR